MFQCFAVASRKYAFVFRDDGLVSVVLLLDNVRRKSLILPHTEMFDGKLNLTGMLCKLGWSHVPMLGGRELDKSGSL